MSTFTDEELKKEIMPVFKAHFLEDRKGQKLRSALYEFFEKSENPYKTALDFTEKATDFLQPRTNSLSGTIFREFQIWHDQIWKNDRKKAQNLTFDLRRRAYDVCSRRHTHLLTIARDVYNLYDIAECFIGDIRQKAEHGFYKEAVNCVIVLKLQLYFGLNEIVIPCILQDKINFVEPYLDGFPDLQRELVQILDQLCTPIADTDEFIRRHNVSGIRKDKLEIKPLAKLIAKIAKLYNMPPESTPNLTKTRSEGAMRYLLQRRYVEKAIETANFDDMVYTAVETCAHLDVYLLDLLCIVHNDQDEALKWAYRLHVPKFKWPHKLRTFAETNPTILHSKPLTTNQFDENDGIDYLKLPIPIDKVYIVHDEKELDNAMNFILQSTIIGLDTEWQPCFGQAHENVALIQIATKERVFLFDLIYLAKNVEESKIYSAMEQLFCNENLLKLGFQFGGDMKTLMISLPFCRDVFYNMQNVLCIGSLVDNLKRQNLNFMWNNDENSNVDQNLDPKNQNGATSAQNGASEEAEKPNLPKPKKQHCGLSEVCDFFLGKPLSKSEQFSNWARRPLRENQIIYAALDAHCLLYIYEKVKQRASELGLNYEKAVTASIISSSIFNSKPKPRKMPSLRNMERKELLELVGKLNENSPNLDPNDVKTVKDVKIVVDNMLKGLGRHLRRCGIDTEIFDYEKRDFSHKIVNLALRENRIVLSSGCAFASISQRLPPSMCVSVPNAMNSKDQLTWFLQKYNIIVSEKDIFSRCTVCNYANYLILPAAVFRTVWDSLVAPNDYIDPTPFDNDACLDRINNCLKEFQGSKYDEPKFDPENWIFTVDNNSIDLLTGIITVNGTSAQSGNNQSPQNDTHSLGAQEAAQPTKSPVIAKIETLPSAECFNNIDWFYICCNCGKIYWEGAHMQRYVDHLGFDVTRNVDVSPNP